MTDKTAIGRSKNVECPYCGQAFYSVNTLNVHIAYKHPGERTLTQGAKPKHKLESFKPKSFKQIPQREHKNEVETMKKQPQYDEDADDESEDEAEDEDPY